jgi:pentapeptide MXKDX repeat protein
MSRWFRSFDGIVFVTGLGFALAGCSKPSSPAMGEKMSGEKMGGEKMGGEKMGGEKLGGEKMGGDKMSGDKIGGDKMKDKPGG